VILLTRLKQRLDLVWNNQDIPYNDRHTASLVYGENAYNCLSLHSQRVCRLIKNTLHTLTLTLNHNRTAGRVYRYFLTWPIQDTVSGNWKPQWVVIQRIL